VVDHAGGDVVEVGLAAFALEFEDLGVDTLEAGVESVGALGETSVASRWSSRALFCLAVMSARIWAVVLMGTVPLGEWRHARRCAAETGVVAVSPGGPVGRPVGAVAAGQQPESRGLPSP
jgi:hypothetical protein